MQVAIGLDRCPVSKEDYEETLRRKGVLARNDIMHGVEPKDSTKG